MVTTTSDKTTSPLRSQHYWAIFGGEELTVQHLDAQDAKDPRLAIWVANLKFRASASTLISLGQAIVRVVEETLANPNDVTEGKWIEEDSFYPRFGLTDVITPVRPQPTLVKESDSVHEVSTAHLRIRGMQTYDIQNGDQVAVLHVVDPQNLETTMMLGVNDLRVHANAQLARSFGLALTRIVQSTLAQPEQAPAQRLCGRRHRQLSPAAATTVH